MEKIVREDILGWDSLSEIADSLEKRGFQRTELGRNDEIVMSAGDQDFIAIVEASQDQTPSDYNKRLDTNRHTQVVSTEDYDAFTFTTQRRLWDQHGQIKYAQYQITKEQFETQSQVRTPLEKLNSLAYGDTASIYELYETQAIIDKFYDEFEELRAKAVNHVTGVPEGKGDVKQNYAQTIFDRLIFLHFIQEKKLLDYDQNYLEHNHERVLEEDNDVYEAFYKPLFFEWLATDTEHPDQTLPYLNGGLFTQTDIERDYPEIRLGGDKEETNELYTEILDFLGDWNWHADERLDIVDPNRLSPELLGHIFEKTVNQKEMGAYYTPEEITHFMSRNTIHPYILDQLNNEYNTNYEEIDDVFHITEDTENGDDVQIGSVDDIERDHIEHLYFDILPELKVLDPAVGSGAFLLAAQQVLLDIYMSCIEYFQTLADKRSYEMTGRIADLVETLQDEPMKPVMHAKRQIILNNLYGVDIDKGATEICKLRLWLSIVADLQQGDDPHNIETLPNIDFNIRQGNSLIGFTEPIDKALNDDEHDHTQVNLDQFGEDSIYEKYNDIIQHIQTYKAHEKQGNGQKAKQARRKAFQKIEEYREEPDRKILQQFHEAGVDDVDLEDIKNFSPFHWVLEFAEVYSDGGFDVIVGNPPWDKVKAERDDFFPRYYKGFRQISSPSKKDAVEKELKSDQDIKSKWLAYKEESSILSKYYNAYFNLQKPEIYGITQSNEKDMSSLFLERVMHLSSQDGYISQILPGVNYQGGSKKDLRRKLLHEKTVTSLAEFENHGIFDNKHVDVRYKFGIVTFKNSGETESVRGTFSKGNSQILKRFDERAVEISRELIKQYSPEALMLPYMKSERQIQIISRIIDKKPLSESSQEAWNAIPYRELDRTNDSDKFIESEVKGDYPVYGGSNIYQFEYDSTITDETESPEFWSVKEKKNPDKSAKRRIREKVFKSRKEGVGLKKSIYLQLDGNETSQSQIGFVNDILQETRGQELSIKDVKLDCNWPRIVIRHVTNSTNERTIIATVIPEGIVTHNALTTIRPIQFSNIDKENLDDFPLQDIYEKSMTTKEMFYLVGVLNSLVFDYLMRTKIEENMVMYKFKESHLPRLKLGDMWFDYISQRSAKLNCYGEEFSEIREELGGFEPVTSMEKRKAMQAEIDAASFQAYGLMREDVMYILENFGKVSNPRMMTREYFDMVLEKYDELAEEGPKP